MSPNTTSEQRPKPMYLRGEGKIAGVAEGLAKDFEIDLVLLRIVWIVAACMGVGILLYLACWIAFPKASDPTRGEKKRIFGVCLEVARRAQQPVGLIRFGALALLFFSGGAAVVGYVLALLILPSASVRDV